jgi:xanthine dehydrogenase large subunit
LKHLDAAAHTRGTSRYVDDVPPPEGMLHAAVFGSPVAHGILRSVDTAKACSCEGVAAVLLASDIPGKNQIGPVIPDEPLLAAGAVHFMGQPIAVVLADSPQQARQAVARIEVDIEELPVITDPKAAYAAGAVIGKARTVSIGDVDTAWQECDLVLSGECDIGGQEHVYLETQRSRAEPLENGHIRLYASTQSPYAAQRMTAQVLGLPHHAIEVDVKRLGGGFGGKEDQATPWAAMAALGAQHTGRAVELVLRRHEDLTMTGKRHPYRSDWKIGLNKEGQILAFEAWNYQNSGAAADLSPPVLARTLFHATNAYRIPNARIFGVCCRTNLPPNTAFRGFGGPQGMFVIESALAKAAETLGVPREELQRKNLLRDGDSFPYGQVVREGRAERTWDEAAEFFDLAGWRQKVKDYNSSHKATKKGFATMPICFGISFTATFMNQAGSLVHVYTDGSVAVSTGGVEMGQGVSTNMATVVARTLGIHEERVKVESTNTTRVANMSASAASATTLLNGNAALLACQKILKDLKAVAAADLGLPSSETLTLVNEQLLADGEKTDWTWERLVQAAYFDRVPLSAHAHFSTPNVWYDEEKENGRPFAYHVFGTAMIEVTLDALRGTYSIDTVKILHDLGRPMNEKIDLGQVEGGLAQGLGWMTLEDLRFNEQGRCLSGALATYKVPDVDFMPDDLEVRFLENAGNPLGPFHSKAVGEPPLMYGIGVFFALRDSMRAVRADEDYAFTAPLTPERVLMELYRHRMGDLVADHPAEVEASTTVAS